MKKKVKEYYFADKQEQAVINYIISDSREERNRIYNRTLREPFRKMIQSILRRYPIHIGNYEMEEVEQNALSHLIEHMVKYKPFIIERKKVDSEEKKWYKLGDRGRFMFIEYAKEKLEELNDGNDGYDYRIFYSRAYSYCQTIVRNYFKDHSKKSYNEKKVNLSYDDYIDDVNQKSEYHYELEDEDHYMLDRLINDVIDKINCMIESSEGMKKNEVIVGEAVTNVLENWQYLFLEDSQNGKYNKKVTNKFAKNKILLFLKEQTGLATKEIRVALKPFKDIYFFEKIKYLED